MAKNITLAVEDEVLDAVRVIAAQQKTSVSGLVRDFLKELATREDRRETARRRLVELAENSTASIGPDFRWNREELYEERLLPRHQRADLRGGGED